MYKEKFNLITLIKSFIILVDENLENFPKKDLELKYKLNELTLDLLYTAFRANNISNLQRRNEFQEDMIAKLKMIDFIIYRCKSREILSAKKYLRFSSTLEHIVFATKAWNTSNKTNINLS